MLGWLERKRERQSEIDAGVDADLFRDNRKRWKLSLYLFEFSFVLLGIQRFVRIHGILQDAVIAATIFALLGAFILAQWARTEQAFLNRPDSKEPPGLSK